MGRGLSRREMIAAGLSSAWLLKTSRDGVGAASPPSAAFAAPRDIIFMVSDGMSSGVPWLAESFSRMVRGRGTHWCELLRNPEVTQGWFETASLNSPVTDSAAASTAWFSASRVNNGAINVLPDGTRLTPLAQVAQGCGRRVGIVTTATITHATPAGFAAVQADRDDEAEIAPQYAGEIDVLLGGGRKHFEASLRPTRTDIISRYTTGGYTSCASREQILAARTGGRRLGLFAAGHLPYTIDRLHDSSLQQSMPTLAEMTIAALRQLEDSPRGFILQVEGARVDHAAHANDAASLLWEQLVFDDALGVALAFFQRRPDTLLVVTSDHGNASPSLVGVGEDYERSGKCFERLARCTASGAAIAGRLTSPAVRGPADVIAIIEQMAGVQISRAEAAAILTHRPAEGKVPPASDSKVAPVVLAVSRALSAYQGIGWTGTTHTAEPAPILALGPGRIAFAGPHRNTEVFGQLSRNIGSTHRNPECTKI
jgi:alkaline phosphatase